MWAEGVLPLGSPTDQLCDLAQEPVGSGWVVPRLAVDSSKKITRTA